MKDDSFFWFKEHRLVIPGVEGEHLLMHITDTHISTIDELSTEEERAETEKQEALWADFKEKFARGKLPFSQGNDEPYGDPQKISTVEAFEKQLALAKELQPEVLLLSGDNLDHMHPAGARYLKKKLADCDEGVLRSLSASMKAQDNREAVGMITVPLTYFYADPGSLFSPKLADWCGEHVKTPYKAVRFPDSDRMLVSNYPEKFAEEVGKLL